MREATIVLRRELRSFFLSPIAYVFGVLFLGLQLYLSVPVIRDGGTATMAGFFGLLPSLPFLVFIPALAMRTWSEERKLGTLELLMTFPVTVGQLIAGKFLAAMAYLAVILAMTLGLPLTLEIYGDLDWGPVVAAYAASLLVAAAYVSVGMFFSSITREQIVALLLTFVTLGILYLLGWPGFLAWLEAAGFPDAVLAVCRALSPFRYFVSIARGVLDTRDLVYYAAFCGFFLHASALVLRAQRVRG